MPDWIESDSQVIRRLIYIYSDKLVKSNHVNCKCGHGDNIYNSPDVLDALQYMQRWATGRWESGKAVYSK